MSDIQDRIAQALADLSRKERAVKDTRTFFEKITLDAAKALHIAQSEFEEVSASAEEDLSAIATKRTEIAALLTAGNVEEIEHDVIEATLASFTPETTKTADPSVSQPTANPTPTSRKRSRPSVDVNVAPTAASDSVSDATSTSKAATRFAAARREKTDLEIDTELNAMLKYSSLPNCPIIVKVDHGDWRELACDACDGNFSAQTGTLLKGISAFITHLSKSHGYPATGFDRCIVHCAKRQVPQEELRQIYRNRDNMEKYITIRTLETEKARRKAVTSKKDQEHTEDWKFVKDTNNFLQHCSCIVRHPDGHWVELHCPVCQGNWTSRGYLKGGVKGFWDHIHHAHGEPRMAGGPRAIIERCLVWDLSDEDVAKMKKRGGSANLPLPVSVYSTKKEDQEQVDDEEAMAEDDGGGDEGGDVVDLTESPPQKRRRFTRSSVAGARETEDEAEMAEEPEDNDE